MRSLRLPGCVTLLYFVLCFAQVADAQQPDFRVRLLSLFNLQKVRVTATGAPVVMHACRTCKPSTVTEPTEITAQEDRVVVDGRSTSEVRLLGSVKIEANGAASLTVSKPLTIRAAKNELVLIAGTTVEDYVAFAVQGESSGTMPPEALKALAVTVRTYATRFRNRHRTDGFDFCDSTHCQHLRLETDANVRRAVDETRGQLLWYRGTPAATFHHQDCGGSLEAAHDVWPDLAAPYLNAKVDEYCVRGQRDWTSTVEHSDLDSALAFSGIMLPRNWDHITVLSRTSGGRARLLRFDTRSAQGPKVSASSLRFAVGRALGWNVIKSDLYQVASPGSRVTFTGRGNGHGVGLCQLGAIEMAREGESYRDILGFYFPGTALGVSAQGIEWRKTSGNRLDVLTVTEVGTKSIIAAGERVLHDAEARSGIKLPYRPAIKVFPTVSVFRDATGEPGWVAASTRGRTIRLQPIDVLQRRGEFESCLRHEMLHLLIESRSRAGTPLWLREGLVLYLGDEKLPQPSRNFSTSELEIMLRTRTDARPTREAYAAARARTEELIRRFGKAQVLGWLSVGIPGSIRDH